jgi:thermitase
MSHHNDCRIECVEPKRILISNDEHCSLQRGLSKIKMPISWDLTIGSISAIVGVIDTGFDYACPDLMANVRNYADEISDEGIENDGNGVVDNCMGWDFVRSDNYP